MAREFVAGRQAQSCRLYCGAVAATPDSGTPSGTLWRTVRGLPDFSRLLMVRAASQCGDGLFQAGLAGGLLFNPQRAASPWAVAGAFAVAGTVAVAVKALTWF